MSVLTVSVYNSIDESLEAIELSREVSLASIEQFHTAFRPMKLSGQVMKPFSSQVPISKQECKDYADDLLYDEQQCRAYLMDRRWEDFGLTDAAVVLGYQHAIPEQIWYSAMPYMFELILKADKWLYPFDHLVSRLRDEVRKGDAKFQVDFSPAIVQAVVDFLSAIGERAVEAGHYETATVATRTIALWKAKAL
jgi:hypothetical protein